MQDASCVHATAELVSTMGNRLFNSMEVLRWATSSACQGRSEEAVTCCSPLPTPSPTAIIIYEQAPCSAARRRTAGARRTAFRPEYGLQIRGDACAQRGAQEPAPGRCPRPAVRTAVRRGQSARPAAPPYHRRRRRRRRQPRRCTSRPGHAHHQLAAASARDGRWWVGPRQPRAAGSGRCGCPGTATQPHLALSACAPFEAGAFVFAHWGRRPRHFHSLCRCMGAGCGLEQRGGAGATAGRWGILARYWCGGWGW
jgi:hypothetical protein